MRKSQPPVIGMRINYCNRRNRHDTLYSGKSNTRENTDFRLLVVLDGKIEVQMVSTTLTASKGCVLAWPPGSITLVKASPKAPPSYYLIRFTPHLAEGTPVSVSDIGLEPFFRLLNLKTVVALLKKIAREFRGYSSHRLSNCSILGIQLLLALKPCPSDYRSSARMPDERDPKDRLDSAVAYIARNYKKRISVNFLADMVSMHRVNFTAAFKEVTGLTPHQYILRRKIEKAQDFLVLYNERPAVTALELGFHDYAHFFKVFKQHTGLTPDEYRKKEKKGLAKFSD